MDEQTTETTQTSTAPTVLSAKSNSFAIPASIVIGFGLIAAAIFFSGSSAPQTQNADTKTGETPVAEIKKAPIKAIDSNDHIKGNPNAPIVILTYTDFDCPYCKNFHETMDKIMDTYGKDGKVAWVYRHSPIPQLHPSAPRVAQASECVAKLGGNDAFWKFTDFVFGERSTNEPTNTTRLTEFATDSGVSATAFDSCLEDGQTKALVDEDIVDAVNAGMKGTPYSLVLVGGQQGIINGAQPYAYVSSVLDTLIAQTEGKKSASTTAQ